MFFFLSVFIKNYEKTLKKRTQFKIRSFSIKLQITNRQTHKYIKKKKADLAGSSVMDCMRLKKDPIYIRYDMMK